MMNRWIMAALCTSALACAGLALAVQTSEQESARQLFRTLDRYSYYYDAVRVAETNLASYSDPQQLTNEVRDVEQRLLFLADRLSALKIRGSVRRQMLDPLVDRLRDDRADLASVREYVQRTGLDSSARARLGSHVHSDDALRPVIGEIRERFGFRMRLWRGHPLTA